MPSHYKDRREAMGLTSRDTVGMIADTALKDGCKKAVLEFIEMLA